MAQVKQSADPWREQRDQWSKIWFEQLCRFHRRKPTPLAEFTTEDAISFLRDHLRRKTPAWKRLKIDESLVCYRRNLLNAGL